MKVFSDYVDIAYEYLSGEKSFTQGGFIPCS